MPLIPDENPKYGTVALAAGECYDVAVYEFPNGNFAVCDIKSGWQIPELQGRDALSRIHQAIGEGKVKVKEWKK